jgi:hypothetical protein
MFDIKQIPKRERKFRGRWKDTGKLIPDFQDEYIIDAINDNVFIVDDYINYKDKNGKEIYEGDIVKFGDWEHPHPIVWRDGRYWLGYTRVIICEMECANMKVVGDVYNNSDLLSVDYPKLLARCYN